MPSLTVAADVAVVNLAAIHGLDAPEAVYETRRDGHVVFDVAVRESTAEAWRAAFAAPAFRDVPRPNYVQRRTEVLWFGAEVRLTYVTF